MKTYDVYSYGVIASSTQYLLKDPYPAKSGYAEFDKVYRSIGGEAANTSIVLSRLGVDVKLDGNWINPDEEAVFIRDVFDKNRIDISNIAFKKCQGPKEMLLVASGSRTIFGTYGQLSKEKSWNSPKETDIQNAKVICLDPFFNQASIKVAEYATKHHKPVVTVDCQFDHPIFLAADAAIISEEYLRDVYPNQDVSSITEKYKEHSKGIMIFTFGGRELIYGSQDEEFQIFRPYSIDPVDTTGAGDSFRAGIIFGLLKKWPTDQTIRFASAIAAVVCQTFPGVLNSPSYEEVINFIEKRGLS